MLIYQAKKLEKALEMDGYAAPWQFKLAVQTGGLQSDTLTNSHLLLSEVNVLTPKIKSKNLIDATPTKASDAICHQYDQETTQPNYSEAITEEPIDAAHLAQVSRQAEYVSCHSVMFYANVSCRTRTETT